MKKILTITIILGLANLAFSQNFGVDKPNPVSKLDVNGGIMRTNTRVSASQSYPLGQGDGLFPIDPTWTNAELQAYFNSANVSWINDATAPGGWAIQITGSISVGGVYNAGFPYIPIDQGASYYMECWIKNTSGSNGHYMGSIDFDQNFSNLGGNPGSYGYWVMSNYNPGSSWVKVSGTIAGFGTSVGTFVNGSKYWTPQALFNYSGGGTCEISGWKVIRTLSSTSSSNKLIIWSGGSTSHGTAAGWNTYRNDGQSTFSNAQSLGYITANGSGTFTFTVTGMYRISFWFISLGNNQATNDVDMYKNGSRVYYRHYGFSGNTGQWSGQENEMVLPFNAGDTFYMNVYNPGSYAYHAWNVCECWHSRVQITYEGSQ